MASFKICNVAQMSGSGDCICWLCVFVWIGKDPTVLPPPGFLQRCLSSQPLCGSAGNPYGSPTGDPAVTHCLQQFTLDPELLQHFHVWVFVSAWHQNRANSGSQNPALHQTADPLGQRAANSWGFVSVPVFAWYSVQCWRKEQKVLWGSFWQAWCANTQSRLILCFSYSLFALKYTSRNPTVNSPHTLLTLKNPALLEFI